MTPDQLAERIMDRIEKDQAIHKSSIVEEFQLACAPVAKPMAQINRLAHQHMLVTGVSIFGAWGME